MLWKKNNKKLRFNFNRLFNHFLIQQEHYIFIPLQISISKQKIFKSLPKLKIQKFSIVSLQYFTQLLTQ